MLPGGIELWVVVFVIVLLFGAKKLPQLGSGLGKAIGNFKSAYKNSKAIDVTPEEESEEKKDSES